MRVAVHLQVIVLCAFRFNRNRMVVKKVLSPSSSASQQANRNRSLLNVLDDLEVRERERDFFIVICHRSTLL